MSKGVIADVERFSTHDGPGIRTVVFFKGCPLKCEWCHNPECISFEKQTLFYTEKCIGCGKCDQGCYTGAKVVCGKEYTPNELLFEILCDKPYYGDKGGVTFSGGEPFAQSNFLSEIVDLCKENDINCAVETSLFYMDAETVKKLDLVMADLKIWNSEIHKKYTGVVNETIIENFKLLDSFNIPIIMRTPVIPGINQGINEISTFAKSLKNVIEYELLPYHPLGDVKRDALGIGEVNFEVPSREYMEELNKYAFICR